MMLLMEAPMTERRDRRDYHCARARVGRDISRVRRGEGYESYCVFKAPSQPRRW